MHHVIRRVKRWLSPLLLALCLVTPCNAEAESTPTTIGNGGDPVAQLFADGKRQAMRHLQVIADHPRRLDGDPAATWLGHFGAMLLRELEQTQIRLVDTFNGEACLASACTCPDPGGGAVLQINISRCAASVTSPTSAGRLLLYEAVLRLDHVTAALAEDVGAAVYRCQLSDASPATAARIDGENWPGNLADPDGGDFDDYNVTIDGALATRGTQMYAARTQTLRVRYTAGTSGQTDQQVLLRVFGCDGEPLATHTVSAGSATSVEVQQGTRISIRTIARTGASTRTYDMDDGIGSFFNEQAFTVTFEH